MGVFLDWFSVGVFLECTAAKWTGSHHAIIGNECGVSVLASVYIPVIMRCEKGDVGKSWLNLLTTVVSGGIEQIQRWHGVVCTKTSEELLVTSTVHDVICMFNENYRYVLLLQ